MPDRKLIDYLPTVLQDVVDFREINDAVQPEIDKAWDALHAVIKNQFVESANEDGIVAMEKDLNIKPQENEDLEKRRSAVRAANSASAAVYTFSWFKGWLRSIYATKLSASISEYSLTVPIPATVDARSVIAEVEKYIPCNIYIKPIIVVSDVHNNWYVGTSVRMQAKSVINCEPWDTSNAEALVDENKQVLLDENDQLMYEGSL